MNGRDGAVFGWHRDAAFSEGSGNALCREVGGEALKCGTSLDLGDSLSALCMAEPKLFNPAI